MPSIIVERSFEFALRVLKLSERLWGQGPVSRHIASQLMRCGTSVGANAEEAQEGQSKADFIARLSVSRKECRETRYWLRLAVSYPIVKAEDVRWELNESAELLAMIRSALKTARASNSRGGF
jgi:four helix bundle protein